VDPGFDIDRLVLFTVRPELSGYQGPRVATLHRDIENRLLEIPGVRAVTSSAFSHTLLDGGVVVMYLPGGPASADPRSLPSAGLLAVEDDFFATLGIPLKRGRTFAPHDTRTSTPVAVVNETLARTLFPGVDPIGKTFRAPGPLEIVGVVADAKVNSLREPAPLTIYRSVSQLPLPGRRFVVRADGDVRAQMALVREAIREVDPQLALQDLSTQLERIETKYLMTERMFAAASSSVGGLALAVTVIGLFGLMSYTVERRTKEIGIRMALGARRDHLLRSVLKEALITVGSGAILGLVVALAAGQAVASLLFAISPRDPASLLIAVVLMLLAAALGAYVPSRRATRVDPLIALRCE
jgi:predicted permease